MSEEKKSDFMELRDEQLDEVVGGQMQSGLRDRASKFIVNSSVSIESKNAAMDELIDMGISKKNYGKNEVKTMLTTYGIDVSNF